ncbi:diguanylate cyclase [Accumulibacter sp.]|uniref:GGDEF domain-containing protein n=1 Tax=Accumulibacter sp. TaxID=2053492 RepID=UPI0025FE7906|nr:GGDEF domain-containing protein [Accumulibacter sp.]MCM8595870.1 diguanylate cyclase [Accumulibacter sp.]MCM8627561.1 diguanylate cyclase [Accumulibacter sp.]MDS4050018.1 diguanylate cyclase [Accumulibacter sp.]
MTDTRNPLEIARETLRQLALRKLAPTPANYQTFYNEVARLPNVAGFPEASLRQLADQLAAKASAKEAGVARLRAAIGARSWSGVCEAIVALVIPDRATLEPVEQAAPPAGEPAAPAELTSNLLERLRRLVEILLPALGKEDEWLSGHAQRLLEALRGPQVDVPGVLVLLSSFSQRLSLAAEEQEEIRLCLLRLLHLIIENIGALSLDEGCVQGQIDSLARAVLPPLTLRRLDDVERRLQDVIARQRQARDRTLEAQEAMRSMLAAFISHLATISQSSTDFQSTLESSARQIEEARTIEDLAPLLRRVIDATRDMAEETATAREQLDALQARVVETDRQLVELHQQLQHASASARHDPLTDVLNRRGLDEALAREIASVRRKEAPLSLSLLDVDDFSQINNRLGHATGDSALIHLVTVVRHCMRPVDTLARYGGEEFVILMPDTTLDDGIAAMKRLQRELTRSFFLSGNERLLITFSAGVAQLTAEESGEDALRRADQAMYLAKRAGKNRVMGG